VPGQIWDFIKMPPSNHSSIGRNQIMHRDFHEAPHMGSPSMGYFNGARKPSKQLILFEFE